ncbi:hypothetical protein PF006_g21449 [Phytophthora fragariae]|uniref:Uncharacterized protein n=2 Tax=Phytophthora fragariae TaxID=53985 RepID=A0A6A3RXX3_9STRA|nr:hypothetical protein PF006_g21449 [Phytophthora fragariae]
MAPTSFTAVALALSSRPAVAALNHVATCISSYLDGSAMIPLASACSFGPIRLLDRIWENSRPESTKGASWSLSHFLRSDVHYHRFQFSKSLLAAVARGDLSVVRWLLERFSGCTTDVAVVEEDARCGRREILEFLLEYESQEDDSVDERNVIVWGGDGVDERNVIVWGGDDMANAIEAGHGEMVRWLYESTPDAERNLSAVMGLAVRQGDMSLIQWLMNTVYTVERDLPPPSMNDAAAGGHMEILQWIFEHNFGGDCSYALEGAAKNGRADMVTWLVENGITKGAREAVQVACGEGHLSVVRWLLGRKLVQYPHFAMGCAIREGHLDVVKYLCEVGITISMNTGAPVDKPKRTRSSFTNAQRLEICNYRDQNPKMTQSQLATWAQEALALPRKPSQGMISKLLKRKNDLETMTTEELTSKSRRTVRFPNLDTALARWVSYYPLTVEELLNLPEEKIIMEEPTDEDFCAPIESVKVAVPQIKLNPLDEEGGLGVEEIKERLKWIAKLLIYADDKGIPAESMSGMRILQRDFRDQLNKKQRATTAGISIRNCSRLKLKEQLCKTERKISSMSMNDLKYMDAYDYDIVKRKADFERKVAAVRGLMHELGHDAVVLGLSANFAWITSGARSFVFMATEGGVGSIYVDATRVAVLTNGIEGHRLLNEEMRGLEGEITLVQDPWYAQRSAVDMAKELAKSDKVAVDAADSTLAARIAEERSTLTTYEMDVFRALGKECGELIGEVARTVRPDMTEWEIASQLSAKMWARGITPVVMLVAADERVDNIRHPLPTKKRVKNKAMLVICGQRAGLIASTTRLVYITTTPNATISKDLLRRHEVATYVDAVLMANTRTAGVKAGDMLKIAQDAYAQKGFDGEWKFHHQGGCAAYKSREWVANPSVNRVTGLNQAYAWNPSVAGTKSEDTILCYANVQGETVVEVISSSPGWPMIEHTVGDVTIARPTILHLQL